MGAERVRRLGELSLAGFAIGVTAGLMAAGLSLLVGQPTGWALASGLAFTVPMALFGAGYSALMGMGIFNPGVFAPAGAYWLVAFPLARLSQELVTVTAVTGSPGLREPLLGFLAYQAILSMGFAIGFVWLHERLTPPWLMRIRHRNPEADRLLARYVRHAEVMWRDKERRRKVRAAPGLRSKGAK